MPVPTCGSRSTLTPSPASRRASSASSGIDSESPVTSSVSSAPRRRGRGAERGGIERLGRHRRHAARPAGPPERRPRRSRRRPRAQASASSDASSNGSRSATQPAGSPTARTTSRSTPGLHVLAGVADRGSLEQHEQHDGEQDHEDRRRGRGRRRPAGGVGTGSRDSGTGSELEVDERRDACRRARSRPTTRDHAARPGRARAPAASPPAARIRSSGAGGSSWKPITTTTATTIGGVHSVAGAGLTSAARGTSPASSRLARAEEDPAEHDDVEHDRPAQPRRAPCTRPRSWCSTRGSRRAARPTARSPTRRRATARRAPS